MTLYAIEVINSTIFLLVNYFRKVTTAALSLQFTPSKHLLCAKLLTRLLALSLSSHL